jgi:hypothetical protein
MLIPKNHYTFSIESYTDDSTGYENVIYVIQATHINFVGSSPKFKTLHLSLEQAEKELRGLKIYLRQNHSHVDTDANFSKIV